jgi:hypothetical protein
MLLKCIDKGSYHLTPGKNYQAELCLDCPSEFFPGKQVFDYYIINDLGHRHGVESNIFIDLDVIRDKKLNKILNEL